MPYRNTSTQYGSIAKFFHWTLFVLIVGMLCFGFLMDDISKDLQPTTINLHKLTGLLIFFLMLARLVWALINTKPDLPRGTSQLEKIAERGGHAIIYCFLLAMPLVGWMGTSAAGVAPHLDGLIVSLTFMPHDKSLAKTLMHLHGTIAVILTVIIALHIVAALYHHFIKKDDVLRRMLPYRH